jgi:hypothetical protein
VNLQLKDQNSKLIESLRNMRGLVTTMFEKIESMKKFDAHESQFWKNLSSPSNIIRTTNSEAPSSSLCSAQKTQQLQNSN